MQINFSININDNLLKKMKSLFFGKKQLLTLIILVTMATIYAQSATTDLITFQPGDIITAEDVNHNMNVLKKLVPVGMIAPYGGTEAPDGWLLCNGEEKSRTDPKYTNLFNVIGTSFGGDGDVFRVPDLRGKFLRGINGNLSSTDPKADPDAASRIALHGGNTGSFIGSYQGDTIRAHKHTYRFWYPWDSDCNPGHAAFPDAANDGVNENDLADNGDGVHLSRMSASTELNSGHETRPKNVAVNYIIKY